MFDLHSSLTRLAAPVGLLVAATLWLTFGAYTQADDEIARLDAQLGAMTTRSALAAEVAPQLAAPVFALTTGPGAVTEAPLTLTGISVAGARKSALIAIGGQPAKWLDLGAMRDGVTVMAVDGAGVTVDTPTGFKTVSLSGGTPPAPREVK